MRLSTTSYVVLGLVDLCQPATPYDLKQAARYSVQNFWTLTHTQLYSECTRLAAAELLDEHQEGTGRRRKVYRLTDAGRRALEDWRDEPVTDEVSMRDPGTLKLFFGADPAVIAPAQVAAHHAKLTEYEMLAGFPIPPGMRLALDVGMGHEREFLRFWQALVP